MGIAWKDIVYTDGKIDEEKVMNELKDYEFLLQQVPIVYEHVTGGRMSKTNYFAEDVCREHDDYINKNYVHKDDLRDFLS